jgi:hypothetical protein
VADRICDEVDQGLARDGDHGLIIPLIRLAGEPVRAACA